MAEQELLDTIWPCRRWFCKLFARRVLGYFISKSIVSRSMPNEGEEGELPMTSTEIDLVKEIKDLKNTVQELKTSLAEIKAVLADLTGPFSLYKPSIEEKREVQAVPSSIVQKEALVHVAESKEESGRPMHHQAESVKPETRGIEEIVPVLEKARRVIKDERGKLAGVTLKKVIGLLRTLYEIRKLYPKTNVEDIVNLLEKLSIINSEEAIILRTTMNMVENSLRENVTPEENVLLTYLILRNIGVRDEELEEEVLRTVMESLHTRRKSPKESKGSEAPHSGGSDKWENQQQYRTLY